MDHDPAGARSVRPTPVQGPDSGVARVSVHRDTLLLRAPSAILDLAKVPAADRRWWWPLALRAGACAVRCFLPGRMDLRWPDVALDLTAARLPPGLGWLVSRLGFGFAWIGPRTFRVTVPQPEDEDPSFARRARQESAGAREGPPEEPEALQLQLGADTRHVEVDLSVEASGDVAVTVSLELRDGVDASSVKRTMERWLALNGWAAELASPEIVGEEAVVFVGGRVRYTDLAAAALASAPDH